MEWRVGGEGLGIFDRKDDKSTESTPDFSDVRSGGSSTAPATTAQTGAIRSGQTYVVVKGDSLSKIAEREIWGRQQMADDLRGQHRRHQ
jgi:hypothetical protein